MDFVVGQNTGPSSLGRIAPPHTADDWASKSSRTAHDQPHAIAIALDPQTIAAVLNLVEPIRAAGDLDAASGNAELKRLKHAPEIGA